MLCAESSLLLEATPGFAYYFWMDGSTLPYFQVIDDGMYFVTVYDIHGCQGTDTIIVEFTSAHIDLGSDTIICENGSSLLLDAGEEFTSYLWQDGSTSQFFLVDIEIFGIGSHNFSVSAIDTLNCEYADSILVVICEHTDVTQTIYENLKIYPNPANDVITMELQSIRDDVFLIEILYSYGKAVFRDEKIRKESHDIINLDISNYKTGIYFLRISSKEKDYLGKLLI